MSADNWAVCPACITRVKDELDALDEKIASSYGEVSVEAFDELRADRDNKRRRLSDFERTLREDYEIGIDVSGRFAISYGAGCSVCTFEHHFSAQDQLRVDGPVLR